MSFSSRLPITTQRSGGLFATSIAISNTAGCGFTRAAATRLAVASPPSRAWASRQPLAGVCLCRQSCETATSWATECRRRRSGRRQGRFSLRPIIPSMLRWLTAGESHGPQLTVIIDGLPSGLEISEEDLRRALARRQSGPGRGGRQKIDTDVARIVNGGRGCVTIGRPSTLVLQNKDPAHR